jgi:hypothetical protein
MFSFVNLGQNTSKITRWPHPNGGPPAKPGSQIASEPRNDLRWYPEVLGPFTSIPPLEGAPTTVLLRGRMGLMW